MAVSVLSLPHGSMLVSPEALCYDLEQVLLNLCLVLELAASP